MSAIARFFHSKGVKVSGYDKTPTALTKELEASGIAVHYEENVDLIPKDAQSGSLYAGGSGRSQRVGVLPAAWI